MHCSNDTRFGFTCRTGYIPMKQPRARRNRPTLRTDPTFCPAAEAEERRLRQVSGDSIDWFGAAAPAAERGTGSTICANARTTVKSRKLRDRGDRDTAVTKHASSRSCNRRAVASAKACGRAWCAPNPAPALPRGRDFLTPANSRLLPSAPTLREIRVSSRTSANQA